MHLVINFCGTGDNGSGFLDGYDYVHSEQVKTLFVEGCDKEEVCDAAIFPDLKNFAQRFAQGVFSAEGENLRLTTHDLHNLAMGISRANVNAGDVAKSITGITLCGYSRGAVTCFEVAKVLKEIAPSIPIDIVADQPVPGNIFQVPGANANSIADCSKLDNLENVSVILGAYTGQLYMDDSNIPTRIATQLGRFVHRAAFSQVVPKLSNKTNRDLIVIPRESHHQLLANMPVGAEHLHMQIAKYLSLKGLVSTEALDRKTREAGRTYTRDYGKSVYPYPQVNKLQSFFGLSKKEAYQHLDKLHPSALLKKGMEWDFRAENLAEWWERQERNSPIIASGFTQHLAVIIRQTDIYDANSLMTLYRTANNWLAYKPDSKRSYQVEALREHVFGCLLDHKYSASDLHRITLDQFHEDSYFLKQWNRIMNSSFVKTEATKILGDAFVKHDQRELSHSELLGKINDWIEGKKASHSSRFQEIVKLRDQLQDMISDASLDLDQPLSLNLSLW
ncbi:hypothetical protein BN59_00574 [Legionella massiliensis]|uniref:DUF5621 domain-containing protein n=1 Tax=Legionella massiliensis TaxID=1034943 RepID=A0A078KTL8_9GAMM|nr:hypothetical protein [Legionella massiliensis]CDZ76307.1 hypothetical protein BN59_00574 [Legionella massiliensis]CEE12045.1 hypothetical protein BN1094_00574 [Legionella massiliensis]